MVRPKPQRVGGPGVARQVRLLVSWIALASSRGLLKCSVFKPSFGFLESASLSYCFRSRHWLSASLLVPPASFLIESRAMVRVNHTLGMSVGAAGCASSSHLRNATGRARARGDARRSQRGLMLTSKLRSRFFHDDTRRHPTVSISTSQLMVKEFRFTLRSIVLTVHAEWITG